MGTHHSGLVKWVNWYITGLKKYIDRIGSNVMETVITKHKYTW